jgi:predicted nuclease with TOPRIM domain
MEIDIPPESPDLDAQHTQLQSRYETLQHEHKSILAQQEILGSRCRAQHKKINYLENENAGMNRLLEKHKSEQQELNDAYCHAMEEQEAG